MSTIYRRKLYRKNPVKLNWFDLSLIWLSGKADIAENWMNCHPFTSGLVFFSIVFFCFFFALGV